MILSKSSVGGRWCKAKRLAAVPVRWRRFFMVIVLPAAMASAGCGDRGSSGTAPQIAYYDLASKQVVAYPAADRYPAVHPETGQATLMPAMYCQACKAWRQGPPPEQVQRASTAIRCSKCQGPLQWDGPLPVAEL